MIDDQATQELPFCQCGCGERVSKAGRRFRFHHHRTEPKEVSRARVRRTLIDRSVITDNGCWVWQGTRNALPNGVQTYGRIRFEGSAGKTHRVAYEVFVGPIPDGKCVLHRCDNPGCVNPDHLFLGTMKDNSRDREAKGRGNRPVGADHWTRKYPERAAKLVNNFRRKH